MERESLSKEEKSKFEGLPLFVYVFNGQERPPKPHNCPKFVPTRQSMAQPQSIYRGHNETKHVGFHRWCLGEISMNIPMPSHSMGTSMGISLHWLQESIIKSCSLFPIQLLVTCFVSGGSGIRSQLWLCHAFSPDKFLYAIQCPFVHLRPLPQSPQKWEVMGFSE